jgi:hypothetical protein
MLPMSKIFVKALLNNAKEEPGFLARNSGNEGGTVET